MDFQNSIEGVTRNICPVRFLTPDEGDYFFGYYDLRPYSNDGRRHLANRLPFTDRLNRAEDRMTFGYVEDGVFTKLGETRSWCFQQGAMLQYQFDDENILYYNDFDGTAHTVRRDLRTGQETLTDRACAAISRDGRHGLSVNFARIWDFRPGYGYPNLPDPFASEGAPAEDGVFLCDFSTGKSRLIADYARILREFPIAGKENAKFLVNHITWNPSGDRFLMLVRNFATGNGKWATTLITSDLEGNMRALIRDSYVSHYWWLDDRHILAHCTPTGTDKKSVYLLEDSEACPYEEISAPEMVSWGDIHCIASPDGKYMIGDTYPKEGVRYIWIENLKTRKAEILLGSKTVIPPIIDIRCDLHVRFSPRGDRISFDSYSRGKRDICEIDLTGFNL